MTPIDQFLNEIYKSINLFRPEAALVITFLAALIFDLIFKKSKNISGYIALIGFAVTAVLLFQQNASVPKPSFIFMLAVDPFAKFFKYIILFTSFLIILMSFLSDELYKENRRLGEYFTLIVGMTFGMFLLVGATNMIMIYLAIETMSLSSYVLAGYTKEIKRASEASLKYVIFGAVSSGIMIYGISILYGLTGTLNLYGISMTIMRGGVNSFGLIASGLMIIAGIGYKISAVPFHFWTPDVYEGSPITITAYLSVASKAAGFAVLIRFLEVVFPGGVANMQKDIAGVDWKIVIAVLSVLTMTLGNLVALWQTNLKRLLAYSSIAHAGYMLMGVVVMNKIGASAVMTYFFFYMFMNLGAFLVVMLFANKIGSEDIEDYSGIGYRSPILGVCMVIFLLSLTGIPPTAGFIGKYVIFQAVLDSGHQWVWLAVVGVLNSVVSLFYYVKIFRNMFIRGVDTEQEPLEFSPASIIMLFVLVIPTLVFGLYFGPVVNWATESMKLFFAF
ncbi:MAG: NADH-quinone oxidoreductase subunit [Bacteroidota bacterium]|nr:NADH-quinone oxidoreductase subunit [Bacteroidota bacterium]